MPFLPRGLYKNRLDLAGTPKFVNLCSKVQTSEAQTQMWALPQPYTNSAAHSVT